MDGRLLNCEVHGERSDTPTLVLVHGVAGSLHIWDPIIDNLARDYQVVRLDLLGYGHSPKPRLDYTPKIHVEAIRSTLQQQGVAPPYTLVGLSMGVTLVLEFAERYPNEVASIIGMGFPYYRDTQHAKQGLKGNIWAGLTIWHPLVAQVFIPSVWGLGRIGVLPAHSFTKIYSPLMAHDTLLNPYRVFRSNIWHCMVATRADELLQASADVPRLFLHGDADAWATAEDVQAAVAKFPRSEFVLIPHAEHNLVVLKPNDVTASIRTFLAAK